MKKLLILLCFLLITSNCYAVISWTKSWSASDNGSTFGGEDIQNIQSDVSDQAAAIGSNNAFTGTNTFSGSTTFSGAVTGVGVGGKDSISRGFELVWESTTDFAVKPGTLYHNVTQVNNTTCCHISTTVATNYITGVSQKGASKWLYVYIDSSGGCKLDQNAPNKEDASGNAITTPYLYYYYTTTATYYRCIGAVNLDSSGQIIAFYQKDNKIIYDDVYANAELSILSNGAAAAFTDIDCSATVPKISTLATILVYGDNGTSSDVYVRVNGSSATNGTKISFAVINTTNGFFNVTENILLDTSQIFEYYRTNTNVTMDVRGYVLDIR